jgi:ferredoxin-NADP reductase
MTVAEVNALLYSGHHPRERLEKALRITALSPGWRWSFEELVRSQLEHPGATGNAGLVAGAGARTAAPGFRPLRVARIDCECADVISFSLEPMDGAALTKPLAGQFVVLRLRPKPDGPLLFRSYSLSGSLSGGRYRISVKIEPNGAAGRYLHGSIAVGDAIDVSEPRGAFVLQPAQGQGPVVFLSAGIGATPVLAMLHAMAESASAREVWWLHGARDGKTHSFGEEARQLVAGLAHGRSHVWYSRPDADDLAAHDDAHDKEHAYDTAGRFAVEALDALHVPRSSDFYLCGPSGFLGDAVKGLAAWGVPAQRIHSEVFAGGPSMMPGVIASEVRAPHLGPRARPARARWFRLHAAASAFAGDLHRTRACSNWRRRATCPCAGRAARACATTARADWSRAASTINPSRSTRRRKATCCSAAPGRRAMWSSTSDGCRR